MKADDVRTRADLVAFIDSQRKELQSGTVSWENDDLDRFLEALARWTDDMEGWFLNRHEPVPAEPSWWLVAQMLAAAAIYE